MRAALVFALIVAAAIVSSCAMSKPNLCLEVVSPFVEDPIIIPPDLGDNVMLCAPKGGFYGATKECVPLALVRRYLYQHAAEKAE